MVFTKEEKPTSSFTKEEKPTSSFAKVAKTFVRGKLLLQTGSYLLLQTGGKIILENALTTDWTKEPKS